MERHVSNCHWRQTKHNKSTLDTIWIMSSQISFNDEWPPLKNFDTWQSWTFWFLLLRTERASDGQAHGECRFRCRNWPHHFFVNRLLIALELLRVSSCWFRNNVNPVHEPGLCVTLFLCFCTVLSEDVCAKHISDAACVIRRSSSGAQVMSVSTCINQP